MTRCDFSAQALDDLRHIGRYTKTTRDIEQARRDRQELELTLKRLSLTPSLGRTRGELAKGLHSFRVGSHIAFFLVREDGILIVRLLHPSMDIDGMFAA